MKTGLSLETNINKYISVCKNIGQKIKNADVEVLYIDYTHANMVSRKKQLQLNAMLISGIATISGAYIVFVSPQKLRSFVGLKNVAKSIVWEAYNVPLGFTTEHEKDAFCLALYGSNISK
jgi:hypothetical protein